MPTPETLKIWKEFFSQPGTITEVAKKAKISRKTIPTILESGRCFPRTERAINKQIIKIKERQRKDEECLNG